MHHADREVSRACDLWTDCMKSGTWGDPRNGLSTTIDLRVVGRGRRHHHRITRRHESRKHHHPQSDQLNADDLIAGRAPSPSPM